jgi:hypothetical protein
MMVAGDSTIMSGLTTDITMRCLIGLRCFRMGVVDLATEESPKPEVCRHVAQHELSEFHAFAIPLVMALPDAGGVSRCSLNDPDLD